MSIEHDNELQREGICHFKAREYDSARNYNDQTGSVHNDIPERGLAGRLENIPSSHDN